MSQVFVGIGGGTGAGKSTIAAQVVQRLHQEDASLDIALINQDRFFKSVNQLPTFYSEFHQAPRPDFNRPDSFRVETMVAELTAVSGHDVVVLEGILVLYFPQLRQLMTIQCYVETPLEEMLIRRTKRNLAVGYGGSYEDIAHYNLECVTPQHLRYNHPTKQFADIVIPNGLHQDMQKEKALTQLCEMINRARQHPLKNQST